MRRAPHRFLAIGLVTVLAHSLFSPTAFGDYFIPAAGRFDMVHDDSRSTLYISTSSGDLLRFDTQTQTFLAPIHLGGSLRGIDLSPDNSKLVVANGNTSGSNNWVDVIDLTTENVQRIHFTRQSLESGTYTAVFTTNENFLVTSTFSGSGSVPLRLVDTTNGTATVLRSVREATMLTRSADDSVVAYAEASLSSGPFAIFDIATNTAKGSSNGNFLFEIGVSRDGSQVAVPTYTGTYFYDENFNLLDRIGIYARSVPIGLVYSPVADIVYTSWYGSDAIQAYNTNSFDYLYSIDTTTDFDWIGNGAFNEGRLKISENGQLLFATVDGGVNVYSVPETSQLIMMAGAVALVMVGVYRNRSRAFIAPRI